jgi:hypothetical protein
MYVYDLSCNKISHGYLNGPLVVAMKPNSDFARPPWCCLIQKLYSILGYLTTQYFRIFGYWCRYVTLIPTVRIYDTLVLLKIRNCRVLRWGAGSVWLFFIFRIFEFQNVHSQRPAFLNSIPVDELKKKKKATFCGPQFINLSLLFINHVK